MVKLYNKELQKILDGFPPEFKKFIDDFIVEVVIAAAKAITMPRTYYDYPAIKKWLEENEEPI